MKGSYVADVALGPKDPKPQNSNYSFPRYNEAIQTINRQIGAQYHNSSTYTEENF